MKVLIVEDDTKLAQFLAKILTEDGYVADVCRSGADAVPRARSGIYDLVILDWMLPDLDGVSVCRELRNAGMAMPVLMLTARGELKERVMGLESGADDYVVKPFEVEELLARLRALSRRSAGFATLQFGELSIERVNHCARVAAKPLDLTSREYALLLHLAIRPDRVVTRSELLLQVWDTTHDPGTNVVDVNVSRLRDKLASCAWMIETVRGIGYRFRLKRGP
jgi:DNA-binding response OmpR family regulator